MVVHPSSGKKRLGAEGRWCSPALVACVLAGCLLPSCLPHGRAPQGQQLLAGRDVSAVFFTPSERVDLPSYLLVTGEPRPIPEKEDIAHGGSISLIANLYILPTTSTAVGGDLSAHEPIVSNFVIWAPWPTGYTIPTDRLGRLLVLQQDEKADWLDFLRIDGAAKTVESLTRLPKPTPTPGMSPNADNPIVLSPARTRVVFGGSVFELDASSQTGMEIENYIFIGEDIFMVSPYSNVFFRLRPESAWEQLIESSLPLSMNAVRSDRSSKILLSGSSNDGYTPLALVDTRTLVASPLPTGIGDFNALWIPENGHQLLFRIPDNDQSASHLLLYDWSSDSQSSLAETSSTYSIDSYAQWRPGHDEIWLATQPSGFIVWKPGVSATWHAKDPVYHWWPYPSFAYPFSSDGRHWFAQSEGQTPSISVGSADFPAAPTFPLNEAGENVMLEGETIDGKLLVSTYLYNSERSTIRLVDLDTGAARLIGENGHVLAVGHTRVLALLDYQLSTSTGELTLIDLATGTQSPIADDVCGVAVDLGTSADVPKDADRLAPGTRVAFIVRNRIASSYDGLWVMNLP